MAEQETSAEPGSLADKLNHLVATVHPPGRGPYTLDEMVAGIRANGGSVSRTNLNALLLGKRNNPTKSTLEAIARFFGVSVSYLHDDPHPQVTDMEYELLVIIRRAGLQDLVREAGRLRPETLRALSRVIADLHTMQAAEQPGQSIQSS